jgi:hypothetical protein
MNTNSPSLVNSRIYAREHNPEVLIFSLSALSRTTFRVDVDVLGKEGDVAGLTVLMRVRVLRGVRGIGIEYAKTWRWGVPGGEGFGGVGYVLVPKPEATSTGRRPLPVNPSQAE